MRITFHYHNILDFFIIRWKKLAVVERLFQHPRRSFSGRCLCDEAAVVGGLNVLSAGTK